jgi:uroporphyrinogen-III decarboxylase
VEYVVGGHDMASDAGPFYSPRVFHELLLPRLERMTAACHRCGLRYLFASDGNLWPVAEDLFGASGLDGYLEIDRTAGMDLGRLRERFPHLVLLGNISSRTLHMGSPEEVAAEARSCLEEARRSGGIIVGLSNYAQPGTPARNLEALIETLDRER